MRIFPVCELMQFSRDQLLALEHSMSAYLLLVPGNGIERRTALENLDNIQMVTLRLTCWQRRPALSCPAP